jgi:ADP-ribose pyrophosphatase YjhB (NUDIX family)
VRVRPSGQIDVLLVRSRKHPEVFTLPGGGVEGGESTQQAAARETREEAGLLGRLGRCMGELYEERNRSHTTMYALHVEEELSAWDESSRERRWFSLGVPGSPRAGAALEAARAHLSPKRVHQYFFDRLADDLAAVMREGEAAEQLSKECKRAGKTVVIKRRRPRPGPTAEN